MESHVRSRPQEAIGRNRWQGVRCFLCVTRFNGGVLVFERQFVTSRKVEMTYRMAVACGGGAVGVWSPDWFVLRSYSDSRGAITIKSCLRPFRAATQPAMGC